MKEYIILTEDTSGKSLYFVASIVRKKEEKLNISAYKLNICRQIAQDYNKLSFIPLLKVWLGVEVGIDNQPFTMKQLEDITGMSEYQIRDAKKLLEQEDIFKSTILRLDKNLCIGQEAVLNAFYNLN